MAASGKVLHGGAWALALLISSLAAAREPGARNCSASARDGAALSREGIRAVVLDDSEMDLVSLPELKKLGLNTIATGSLPNRATAERLRGAGLSYIGYISSEHALALETDREELKEISLVAGFDSFIGFHYLDENAREGYTTIAAQQKTYTTLKRLFPDKLVLYPLRLDLIRTEEGYLDRYFDHRFTDLLTPYFYPVGTTPLGTFHAGDDWETALLALLVPVRERSPKGQGILPVLQAFEDPGFALDEEFPRRQMEIYERVWPGNRNAAAFAWAAASEADPVVGMAHVPALRDGFRSLFTRLGEEEAETCEQLPPEVLFRRGRRTPPAHSLEPARVPRLSATSAGATGAP